MGNRLFGVDISGEILKALTGQLLTATLHKLTPGTRTGNLTGGTNPTETDYTCEGFVDSQNKENIGGTLVEDGDVQVVLVGDSISGGSVAPITGDRVTIEGTKYNIRGLDRDPAAATYTLLCRAI
jgi:hypothetical protein